MKGEAPMSEKEQAPQHKKAEAQPVTLEEHRVKDIYAGARGTAVKILNRVERTDAYLEKLLDYELKHSEFSSADKALLYELVHGVIRWQGRLDWILSGFYKGQFSKAIPVLKNALRVALYQIMFLDKIPEYAAINEAVEFVKKLQGQKPADITNAVLRNITRNRGNFRFPDPTDNLLGYLSAVYSHPAWIIKRWIGRYGVDFTEAMLSANNERPFPTLRVNTLKVAPDEFPRLLDEAGLRHTKGRYLPDFVKLQNLANLGEWRLFTDGMFTVQDEGQGFACRLLQVKPGMRVLDLCAAPGGKSAYLAALMENQGEIIAVDRFEARLALVEKTLKRLGVTIAVMEAADATTYNGGAFDAVLADVPCSGFGTLSKKPDIKWKRDLNDIKQLAALQYKILNNAAHMVKPGGALVYSTCTIEPEENTQVVLSFLEQHPEFTLDSAAQYFSGELVDANGCIQTYPNVHRIDGAFAARLLRTT